MSIVNDEFKKLFEAYPMRSQDNAKDPLVVTKLFDVAGSATWYLTEYSPEENVAFCYVTGLFVDEWGYVYLPELEELRHPYFKSLSRIERDLHFKQQPISQLVAKAVL